MAKTRKWTVYITETIRHAIEIEVPIEKSVYPYNRPRQMATKMVKNWKKSSPESRFQLEQISCNKPEAILGIGLLLE